MAPAVLPARAATTAALQFGSGQVCDSYIAIRQYPTGNGSGQQFTATDNFRVEFGESSDTMSVQTCFNGMALSDPNSFQFLVNGVDRTSYFSVSNGVAIGTNVPLADEANAVFEARITGHDVNENPRTDVDQKSGPYVDTTPLPGTDASFSNFDNQNKTLCAASCFAAVYAQSTVPYFSLDTPRAVTLAYHGDRVGPRPFVYVDVTQPVGSAAPTKFSLEARVNGVARPFLNGSVGNGYAGETELFFTSSAAPIRLGGQINVADLATNVYPITLVVRSYYPTKSESTFVTLALGVVNEQKSPVARGWTIAGVQRIYPQAGGAVLLTEGDGSAVIFQPYSGGGGCFVSPAGDFSRLSHNQSTGQYLRAYPDSSKAVFSSAGLQLSAADRSSNTTRFEYDGSNRLVRVLDPIRTIPCAAPCSPAPTYITLTYGTHGLQQIVEPGASGTPGGGRTTVVSVGSDSTLQWIKDPDNVSTNFGYDALRRLSTLTDRRGAVTTLHYDERSWKLSSVQSPSFALDPQLGGGTTRLTTQFEPWQTRGVPTSATASAAATPISPDSVTARVIEPGNVATRFTVDRWGQPLVITDALGNVTHIARAGVFATQITEPTGNVITLSYDGPLLTSYGSAFEAPVYLRYGPYAQVDSVYSLSGGPGHVAEKRGTGPGGRIDWIRYASDTARTARFTYDSRNRVTQVSDVGKHVTKYHYEPTLGNLDSTLAPGNRYTRALFDGHGREMASQAGSLAWNRRQYDPMNRVIRDSTDVYLTPTVTTYDALYPTSVTDRMGQTWGFAYNALGQVTLRTDPAGQRDSSYYDGRGLLSRVVNRRGQHVRFTYDALGRMLTKQGDSTSSDSFGYTANGLVQAAWNGVSRDSVFSGPGGWIDSVVTRIQGREFRRRYQKNASTNALAQLSIANPGGAIAFATRQYNWNASTGALNSINVGGRLTTFNRTKENAPLRTAWSSLLERKDTTTALHRTYSQSFTAVNTTGVEPTAGRLLWRGYGYDGDGRTSQERQRLTTSTATNVQYFKYDATGRLTHVDSVLNEFSSLAYCYGGIGACVQAPAPDTIGGFPSRHDESTWGQAEIQYTYDAVGNRTDHSAGSYPGGNRITTFAGMTFLHDADGNVRQRTDAGGTTQFSWTSDGRLARVVRGSTQLDYQYNAFGQLVRRDRNGAPERVLLWDGSQLMAELDGSASQRVAEYAYYPGVDRPLQIVTGPTTIQQHRFFAQTPLGNVEGVVRDTAGLAQDLRYDPFGRSVAVAGTLGDTNRLRWKGMVWEGDVTQLYYARARWYDPATGRFMSEDPSGFVDGMNLYAFAVNNPIDFADPSGMECTAADGYSDHYIPQHTHEGPKNPGQLPTVIVHGAVHEDCSQQRGELLEALAWTPTDPSVWRTLTGPGGPQSLAGIDFEVGAKGVANATQLLAAQYGQTPGGQGVAEWVGNVRIRVFGASAQVYAGKYNFQTGMFMVAGKVDGAIGPSFILRGNARGNWAILQAGPLPPVYLTTSPYSANPLSQCQSIACGK